MSSDFPVAVKTEGDLGAAAAVNKKPVKPKFTPKLPAPVLAKQIGDGNGSSSSAGAGGDGGRDRDRESHGRRDKSQWRRDDAEGHRSRGQGDGGGRYGGRFQGSRPNMRATPFVAAQAFFGAAATTPSMHATAGSFMFPGGAQNKPAASTEKSSNSRADGAVRITKAKAITLGGTGGYGVDAQLATTMAASRHALLSTIVNTSQVVDSDSDAEDFGKRNSVIKQEPAAEDEDEEEDEVVQEVWPSPALAEVYSDPNGAGIEKPVQVPFGPLTAAKWNQLAIAPLFADASDPAALAQEESGAMLLLQFPTQIKLNSSTVETTKQADTDAMDISSDDLLHDASADSSAFTSSGQASSIEDAAISGAAKMHAKFSGTLKQSRKLNTGHIGKLQVMESGLVFLVLNDGTKFELHSGITGCFAQYATSMRVDPNAAADAPPPPPAPAPGGRKMNGSSGSGGGDACPVEGNLSILGAITRKIVVSPHLT